MKRISWLVSLVVLCFITTALISSAGGKAQVNSHDNSKELPVVGSLENLEKLLANVQPNYQNMEREMALDSTVGKKSAPSGSPEQNYSGTNIQVQGVDEGDVVKTDGEYIYQVNGEGLLVIKAYPPENMKVVNTLSFSEHFSPLEIYVDGNYMVVIGQKYEQDPYLNKVKNSQVLPQPQTGTTAAIAYNIKDKNQIKKIREVEIEGRYVSSRRIDQKVYFVANKNIDRYHIMEDQITAPAYRDTISGQEFSRLDFKDIHYLPDGVRPNYIMVCGFNLRETKQEAEVYSYLGAGENIYASPENLYVAATQNRQPVIRPFESALPEDETIVYKFVLHEEGLEYQAKGEVPGRILNQFSMDEYQGNLRLATTMGHVWSNNGQTSQNNLYVLDVNMDMVGKIENIAPGERIYSARFMGDRAYMVTFRKVDPLFVIDLKDPKNPSILGKLKIPGYSDYLHPYDQNHIIGIGKDTVEAKEGNFAYYQGMKLALFDVSDVKNPRQMHKEIIGDRGTDSELLRNHKALLFDKDKNLLAFPVTVMESKTDSEVEAGVRYGEFAFQGAYVYHLSPEKGFVLRAKITHLTSDDYLKAGDIWRDSGKNIKRIIYIGNNLYTLSPQMIKVHDLDTLEEKNQLEL